MEKNILIAQIGQGNYRITNYAKAERGPAYREVGEADIRFSEEESYSGGYAFEAVLKEIAKSGKEIDTLLLVGTETSYWGSLCNYYRNNAQRGQDVKAVPHDQLQYEQLCETMGSIGDYFYAVKQDPKSQRGSDPYLGFGIKDIHTSRYVRKEVEGYLGEWLRARLGRKLQVQLLSLEVGIDEGQLQENFTLLQENLEELLENYGREPGKENKIHIYFDISNGFRSLPVYIYTFANYMARIRREEFELHMYYGMADHQVSYEGKRYAPIVNMEEINDLMLWINAVNEFRNYGSVKQIEDIFRRHPQWDIKIGAEGQKLSRIFKMFEYATNTNYLKMLEETIGSICSLEEELQMLEERGQLKLPKQAVVLLNDMSRDFKRRFHNGPADCPYGYLTLKLAQWYYEQGRIVNAAIALQEGIITYVMENFSEQAMEFFALKNIKMPEGTTSPADMECMQDYPCRNQVGHIFNNTRKSSGEDAGYEVRVAMNKLRELIRNPGAHFLYKADITADNVDQHLASLKWLIELTLNNVERPDQERNMFRKEIELAMEVLRQEKANGSETDSEQEEKMTADQRKEFENVFKTMMLSSERNCLKPESGIEERLPIQAVKKLRYMQNALNAMRKHAQANDFEGFYTQVQANPMLLYLCEEWLIRWRHWPMRTVDEAERKGYFRRCFEESEGSVNRQLYGWLKQYVNILIEY